MWTQQATLTANDGAKNDGLGVSVAISDDTVIAGARGDDVGGNRAGSAYIFQRSSGIWAQQAKLTASDAATLDEFGSAVAIDADTAVVGAPFEDEGPDPLGGLGASATRRRSRTWANQSFRAAKEHVYAGVAADGPATRLDQDYVSKNKKVLDEQLMKAGIRLAEVLNEALRE